MAVLGLNIEDTFDYKLKDDEKRDFYISLEQQFLCRFQVMIIPHPNVFLNLTYDPLGTPLTTIDNAHIGRFYVYSIELPVPSYEYTRMGNKQYVTDVVYPETTTITFIDGKDARCQKYLSRWQDELLPANSLDFLSGAEGAMSLIKGKLNGSADAESAFVQKFKSDPGLAKKNIYVIPLSRDDTPAKVWYSLEGVSFKGIDTITFAQDSEDAMKITATFAVDNARTIKPF